MPPADLYRLYEDHAQAVFSFLLSLTWSEADCRDLLQDLFLKLARHPNLLQNARQERSLLLRMANNAAIDLARRRQTRRENPPGSEAATGALFARTEDPDAQALREALSSALAELPSDQRAVVHLKLWEGLTFDEIAETFAISPNTAASRYRYGLDKLRARLRPLYEEIV
jgi:RNA polymerase sigma-70 factor, ECF subfamily